MDAIALMGFAFAGLVGWVGFAICRYALRESRKQKQLEATLGRRLTTYEVNAYWRTEQELPSAEVIRSRR